MLRKARAREVKEKMARRKTKNQQISSKASNVKLNNSTRSPKNKMEKQTLIKRLKALTLSVLKMAKAS